MTWIVESHTISKWKIWHLILVYLPCLLYRVIFSIKFVFDFFFNYSICLGAMLEFHILGIAHSVILMLASRCNLSTNSSIAIFGKEHFLVFRIVTKSVCISPLFWYLVAKCASSLAPGRHASEGVMGSNKGSLQSCFLHVMCGRGDFGIEHQIPSYLIASAGETWDHLGAPAWLHIQLMLR